MKFIKSFVLAITMLTATTCVVFSQTSNTNQLQDSTKTVSIKVKGITCSMDLKMVSANVEKVKGVSSCKAGKMGTTSSFEVKYNPALVTEKEIHTAIENTGSCENPDERAYKIVKQ